MVSPVALTGENMLCYHAGIQGLYQCLVPSGSWFEQPGRHQARVLPFSPFALCGLFTIKLPSLNRWNCYLYTGYRSNYSFKSGTVFTCEIANSWAVILKHSDENYEKKNISRKVPSLNLFPKLILFHGNSAVIHRLS